MHAHGLLGEKVQGEPDVLYNGLFPRGANFRECCTFGLSRDFTIQKFTNLSTCSQHIARSFVVRITQLATTCNRNLY